MSFEQHLLIFLNYLETLYEKSQCLEKIFITIYTCSFFMKDFEFERRAHERHVTLNV